MSSTSTVAATNDGSIRNAPGLQKPIKKGPIGVSTTITKRLSQLGILKNVNLQFSSLFEECLEMIAQISNAPHRSTADSESNHPHHQLSTYTQLEEKLKLLATLRKKVPQRLSEISFGQILYLIQLYKNTNDSNLHQLAFTLKKLWIQHIQFSEEFLGSMLEDLQDPGTPYAREIYALLLEQCVAHPEILDRILSVVDSLSIKIISASQDTADITTNAASNSSSNPNNGYAKWQEDLAEFMLNVWQKFRSAQIEKDLLVLLKKPSLQGAILNAFMTVSEDSLENSSSLHTEILKGGLESEDSGIVLNCLRKVECLLKRAKGTKNSTNALNGLVTALCLLRGSQISEISKLADSILRLSALTDKEISEQTEELLLYLTTKLLLEDKKQAAESSLVDLIEKIIADEDLEKISQQKKMQILTNLAVGCFSQVSSSNNNNSNKTIQQQSQGIKLFERMLTRLKVTPKIAAQGLCRADWKYLNTVNVQQFCDFLQSKYNFDTAADLSKNNQLVAAAAYLLFELNNRTISEEIEGKFKSVNSNHMMVLFKINMNTVHGFLSTFYNLPQSQSILLSNVVNYFKLDRLTQLKSLEPLYGQEFIIQAVKDIAADPANVNNDDISLAAYYKATNTPAVASTVSAAENDSQGLKKQYKQPLKPFQYQSFEQKRMLYKHEESKHASAIPQQQQTKQQTQQDRHHNPQHLQQSQQTQPKNNNHVNTNNNSSAMTIETTHGKGSTINQQQQAQSKEKQKQANPTAGNEQKDNQDKNTKKTQAIQGNNNNNNNSNPNKNSGSANNNIKGTPQMNVVAKPKQQAAVSESATNATPAGSSISTTQKKNPKETISIESSSNLPSQDTAVTKEKEDNRLEIEEPLQNSSNNAPVAICESTQNKLDSNTMQQEEEGEEEQSTTETKQDNQQPQQETTHEAMDIEEGEVQEDKVLSAKQDKQQQVGNKQVTQVTQPATAVVTATKPSIDQVPKLQKSTSNNNNSGINASTNKPVTTSTAITPSGSTPAIAGSEGQQNKQQVQQQQQQTKKQLPQLSVNKNTATAVNPNNNNNTIATSTAAATLTSQKAVPQQQPSQPTTTNANTIVTPVGKQTNQGSSNGVQQQSSQQSAVKAAVVQDNAAAKPLMTMKELMQAKMKAKKEAEAAKKDQEDQKNEEIKISAAPQVEAAKTVAIEPLPLKKQPSGELKQEQKPSLLMAKRKSEVKENQPNQTELAKKIAEEKAKQEYESSIIQVEEKDTVVSDGQQQQQQQVNEQDVTKAEEEQDKVEGSLEATVDVEKTTQENESNKEDQQAVLNQDNQIQIEEEEKQLQAVEEAVEGQEEDINIEGAKGEGEQNQQKEIGSEEGNKQEQEEGQDIANQNEDNNVNVQDSQENTEKVDEQQQGEQQVEQVEEGEEGNVVEQHTNQLVEEEQNEQLEGEQMEDQQVQEGQNEEQIEEEEQVVNEPQVEEQKDEEQNQQAGDEGNDDVNEVVGETKQVAGEDQEEDLHSKSADEQANYDEEDGIKGGEDEGEGEQDRNNEKKDQGQQEQQQQAAEDKDQEIEEEIVGEVEQNEQLGEENNQQQQQDSQQAPESNNNEEVENDGKEGELQEQQQAELEEELIQEEQEQGSS